MNDSSRPVRRWPLHGSIGAALALAAWVFNWSLPDDCHPAIFGFFPLWLGYCLTIDALVCYRKGSSMLIRSPAGYVATFLVSAPAWWLFELFNDRVQNWRYLGVEHLDKLAYAAFATLSFSTVIPAVFGTAELVSTFGWMRRLRSGRRLSPSAAHAAILFVLGAAMLGLLLAWPSYFFPFLWLSIYFLLEPVNVWLGNRSLLDFTGRGDWRPVASLAVGCLMCGLFWEMWNYWSYPKWIYTVPWVDFGHVFEMPMLGYGGYIPFSWELFALFHLVRGGPRELVDFGEREATP